MKYPRAVWSHHDGAGDIRVSFFGRGLPREPEIAAPYLIPPGVDLAWGSQVHSADVLTPDRRNRQDADTGGCVGEGDALVSRRVDLALAVVTADCVPVLVTDGEVVAAIHAGWRGLVGGVVPAALDHLQGSPGAAWIGPSIGVEAYEVGPEVAEKIVAASNEEVRVDDLGERPHVNLGLAVEIQLRRAGFEDIRRLDICTHAAAEHLWSFRREGAAAGRNFSLIWRQGVKG